MTLRERAARAVYRVYANNCAVPFEDQGDGIRAECYSLSGAVLDELTKPPSDAMIDAGREELAKAWQIAELAQNKAASVFEAMIRAGIEEKEPDVILAPPAQCTKMLECCLGDGHPGSCCDIPF